MWYISNTNSVPFTRPCLGRKWESTLNNWELLIHSHIDSPLIELFLNHGWRHVRLPCTQWNSLMNTCPLTIGSYNTCWLEKHLGEIYWIINTTYRIDTSPNLKKLKPVTNIMHNDIIYIYIYIYIDTPIKVHKFCPKLSIMF